MKTIRERLRAGERIKVTQEEIELVDRLVPITSLHTKLRELQRKRIVRTRKSPRKGGRRWVYQGRRLQIIGSYVGPCEWTNEITSASYFHEPHDLAVDRKTNTVIALAKSHAPDWTRSDAFTWTENTSS